MDIATGVAVLANGAVLASLCIYFQKRFSALELAILKASERNVYTVPYEAPAPPIELPPDTDVVGAWAAERAAMGAPVSDEEIASQRAMWAAEGA